MPQRKVIASESGFPKFLPIEKDRPNFDEVAIISTKKRFVKYNQTGKINLRPRTSSLPVSWIDGRDEIDISEDLLMPDLERASASKSMNIRSYAINNI